MMVKSGLVFFYFEILLALTEARPIQPFRAAFLHWAAATLKGLVEFQNNKNYTTFHHHIQLKNVGFKI